MATKAYFGGSGNLAKKVKLLYFGSHDEVPIYETTSFDETMQESNIGTYFTVMNGSYRFVGSGTTFTSNNSGVGSSSASTTLVAKQNCNISFSYSYSSEASFDKYTIKVGSTYILNAASGSGSSSYSGSITAGTSIIFQYNKDGSVNSGNDKCTFSNLRVIGSAQTLVGTEFKDLAHKVKKIYIGDSNNLARLSYQLGVAYTESIAIPVSYSSDRLAYPLTSTQLGIIGQTSSYVYVSGMRLVNNCTLTLNLSHNVTEVKSVSLSMSISVGSSIADSGHRDYSVSVSPSVAITGEKQIRLTIPAGTRGSGNERTTSYYVTFSNATVNYQGY